MHPNHAAARCTQTTGAITVLLLLLCASSCAWALDKHHVSQARAPAHQVAIIGAGIGGAAAAYQLSNLSATAGVPLHIHVFERSRVGGRTDEVVIKEQLYELGASIVASANLYVLELAKAMHLTPVPPKSGAAGDGFGVFNGTSFVFNQTATSSLGSAWQLLRRYGTAFIRMRSLAAGAAARFGRIYALQRQGRAFATPPDMLAAMGLDTLTEKDAETYMKKMLSGLWSWGAARFIPEFAGAINRVNYNQANIQMNALAGLVSFVPAAVPGTFAIKQGNSQLPKRLLEASGARLHNATVHTIEQQSDGRYSIAVEGQAADAPGPFDAVIVACPMEGSGIELLGLQPTPQFPERTYQTTVTSFITGALNPAWFGVEKLPSGDILVTSDADTPFSVIADKGPCADCPPGSRLYKLFSTADLSPELLAALFHNHTVVASRAWKAYPRFSPPESFAHFALAPGLYYNNALENAASAMEVSAVAAMNSALLTMQHLQEHQRQDMQPLSTEEVCHKDTQQIGLDPRCAVDPRAGLS